MRCLLFFVAVQLVATGCMDRFDYAPTEAEVVESPFDITIGELHFRTDAYDYFDVRQDVTICGVVTANDRGGNFYKSFVMEQDGYAVEVLEGMNYSYVRYPVGAVVTVQLNGLRLARSGGVLQVGVATPVGSYYDVDYMEHEVVADRHIVNTALIESVEPLRLTLSSVSGDEGKELLRSLCGRLVSVEGLRYNVVDAVSNIVTWSGEHIFVDGEGNELRCYTNPYANYSACEIPMGEVSITGMLECDDYGSSDGPMIKMRYEEDCRCD